MNNIKSLLHLLLFFMALLSVVAVPTSRSLKSMRENPALGDLQPHQEIMADEGDMLVVEGVVEGRMLYESTDYPGTGANNHHDPRSPGRA